MINADALVIDFYVEPKSVNIYTNLFLSNYYWYYSSIKLKLM